MATTIRSSLPTARKPRQSRQTQRSLAPSSFRSTYLTLHSNALQPYQPILLVEVALNVVGIGGKEGLQVVNEESRRLSFRQ